MYLVWVFQTSAQQGLVESGDKWRGSDIEERFVNVTVRLQALLDDWLDITYLAFDEPI